MRGPPRRSVSGSPRRSPPTGRCASGSTRIPGCWPRWGLADDPAGWSASRWPASRRSPATSPWSSRSRRSSSGTGRAGSRCWSGCSRRCAARDAATLSLLDVKRGDIGSTMDGYADAYLAVGAPLGADAVTLSPYLGFGVAGLGDPDRRTTPGAGCSCWPGPRTRRARTCSSPDGGRAGQRGPGDRRRRGRGEPGRAGRRRRAGGGPTGVVAIGDGLRSGADPGTGAGRRGRRGDRGARAGPLGAVGRRAGARARRPGCGTADLAARFAGVRGVVLPTASRSVLAAGPDPAAVRAAAAALRDELAAAHGARPTEHARSGGVSAVSPVPRCVRRGYYHHGERAGVRRTLGA